MRVIFLDFDGVMNKDGATVKFQWDDVLDSVLVKRVNKVAVETDAKIVICSAWRLANSRLWLEDILVKFGMNRGLVHGVTPNLPYTKWKERWIEVGTWLMDNKDKVEDFVILDDISDFGPLNPHHVWCNPRYGISEKNVKEAVAILNQGWMVDSKVA